MVLRRVKSLERMVLVTNVFGCLAWFSSGLRA